MNDISRQMLILFCMFILAVWKLTELMIFFISVIKGICV